MVRYPLPDQQCSLGLFRSLSPRVPESNSPMLACYSSATPLFLFFLCLSFSLSLINQCQAVQQQGQHSFPACLLSSSCMSLCADPPPPPAQAATVILSHGHGAETPGPHCRHERFTGSVGSGGGGAGKKKKKAFLSLQSFLHLATGEKKGSLHHLHNSWNTGKKQAIEW